jgi:hypothetical protein
LKYTFNTSFLLVHADGKPTAEAEAVLRGGGVLPLIGITKTRRAQPLGIMLAPNRAVPRLSASPGLGREDEKVQQ